MSCQAVQVVEIMLVLGTVFALLVCVKEAALCWAGAQQGCIVRLGVIKLCRSRLLGSSR